MASTASGLGVVLTWAKPNDNQDALTAYLVKIRQTDGAYSEHSATCPSTGAGAATLAALASPTCTLTMAVLRAAPYSLT